MRQSLARARRLTKKETFMSPRSLSRSVNVTFVFFLAQPEIHSGAEATRQGRLLRTMSALTWGWTIEGGQKLARDA
jgi:hypothetical protein